MTQAQLTALLAQAKAIPGAESAVFHVERAMQLRQEVASTVNPSVETSTDNLVEALHVGLSLAEQAAGHIQMAKNIIARRNPATRAAVDSEVE